MSANNKKYKLPEYLDLKKFLKDHKDKLNTQIVESINSVLKIHDNFFGKLTDSEVSYLLKDNSTFKSDSDKIKKQITKVKTEAESCKNKVESILSKSKKNKEQLDKAVTALEEKQELDDDLKDVNEKINNASSQTEKDELEKIKASIELKIAKNDRALVGFDINQLQNYASISKQAKQTTEETIDMEEELAENMDSTNEALENRAKGINAINTALKDMGGVLMGYVKDGFEKWKEIDEKVYTVGRNIGLSSKELRGYQINVMNNYDDLAAKLGMTFDELFKFQENYTKSTGRAIVLTNNQVESLGAVSKLVGEVATNEMVKNMDDFGASTQTATSYLAVNMARARSQGLDAQKASEAFANNVKLASKYTFREGINGISKMTLLSQKLKFNMDSIANAAEKFETVEGAIGTAANLQMLGGTYSAQFGNPLEAMNMAMLDMEGFTNKIVDTFSGKATFNRETGQVEMSAIDKRLMREAAKQLGISYEEAWNMASQQAKNSDIERDLSKNTQGFTEDEKAFISSKTQFIDGKHQMVFYDEEGNEQQIEIGNLTREQLNIIRSQKDVEHAIQGDVHGIHSLLHEYVKGDTLDKMSWNEARKGINESIAINFADIHDEYMSPVKNLHKDVINEDNRWVLASILGVLGGGIMTAIPMIFSKMMPNIGDTIGKKIFDTFSGWGRGPSTGGTPPTGSTSSGGWGGRIKNSAKSVWGGVKKYGGKALRGVGRVASKLPGWGKVIGIGAALLGGMSLMSAADGSQVDKSKLGGREVEPINNENENTTSSINQQSQELIELQKHTALLQAIANKQGVDVKTIYENSTFNKTDIEDNSEQTTASSILSDSMNTTLMASQVGGSKIAAKGLKAVAGRSGLKMAANMGRMAKAANPLGWISLGSGILKDISGVEEGSGVDKAWSTANAALDGAALGGMIGSVIPGLGTAVGTAVGAAVGGVVGIIDNYGEDIAKATKSVVDGVSGFLFGEDNMTEADKMQQSYEETKLGVVDISDPQLEQKAYMATCKIHDVVISMWHHMNGRQSNGLEEDKGLFGGISNSVNNVTNNVGNALLNTVSAPFKLIGSLFSGNEENTENKNYLNQTNTSNGLIANANYQYNGNKNELLNNFTEKAYYNDETKQVEMSAIDKRLMRNVAKQLNISYDDAWSMVSQNVINNNAYTNTNPYNEQNYENSNLLNTNKVNYRNNRYLSEVSVKDVHYNNDYNDVYYRNNRYLNNSSVKDIHYNNDYNDVYHRNNYLSEVSVKDIHYNNDYNDVYHRNNYLSEVSVKDVRYNNDYNDVYHRNNRYLNNSLVKDIHYNNDYNDVYYRNNRYLNNSLVNDIHYNNDYNDVYHRNNYLSEVSVKDVRYNNDYKDVNYRNNRYLNNSLVKDVRYNNDYNDVYYRNNHYLSEVSVKDINYNNDYNDVNYRNNRYLNNSSVKDINYNNDYNDVYYRNNRYLNNSLVNDIHYNNDYNDVYYRNNKYLNNSLVNDIRYNNDYNDVNYRNNRYLSEVSVKDINYNNDNVIPKVSVGLPTSIKETSVNNYNNSSYNNIGSNKLDLNVSGTIKLTSDRGGNVDIDFNKLLNNTEFMNNLINIISQDFNKRVNGQRENKNSVISLQNGGYNYNIFNATTNGWA